MRLEKYKVKYNPAKTAFAFTSEGPKGHIEKRVYYSKIKHKGYKNLYHLSFGDKLIDSDDIDDQVISDNKDSEKVLATVANTLMTFSKQHPKAQIIFEGSNTTRNRLYRMAISKYFDELSAIFNIYGSFNKKWLPFEKKNIAYSAFLIRRKIS